ncbi:hypothetical protein [Tautonia sociabilis]|uniref:Uncharacterized protein n=1 Tax=Tautonia sociabilis TaxID=2080755 RepID=A0A432MGG9_9BACT|nr:hypothetical protein [Tautonia sociabilis]RUL85743.1 hypothetical protein TsocGM_17890 [Tautonia sociabilis]
MLTRRLEPDGVIRFLTLADSVKVADLGRDGRVQVSYGHLSELVPRRGRRPGHRSASGPPRPG